MTIEIKQKDSSFTKCHFICDVFINGLLFIGIICFVHGIKVCNLEQNENMIMYTLVIIVGCICFSIASIIICCQQNDDMIMPSLFIFFCCICIMIAYSANAYLTINEYMNSEHHNFDL